MRVAPARYGESSRAAATPTMAPVTALTAAAATSAAMNGQLRWSISSAVV